MVGNRRRSQLLVKRALPPGLPPISDGSIIRVYSINARAFRELVYRGFVLETSEEPHSKLVSLWTTARSQIRLSIGNSTSQLTMHREGHRKPGPARERVNAYPPGSGVKGSVVNRPAELPLCKLDSEKHAAVSARIPAPLIRRYVNTNSPWSHRAIPAKPLGASLNVANGRVELLYLAPIPTAARGVEDDTRRRLIKVASDVTRYSEDDPRFTRGFIESCLREEAARLRGCAHQQLRSPQLRHLCSGRASWYCRQAASTPR